MWKENLPENCPPITAIGANCYVFRILKNSDPTEDDFIPYARLYQNNIRYNNLCKAYAISFYKTLENVKVTCRDLLGKGNNTGKYIGKFEINETDGVSKISEKNGHISTWFYETWDFNSFLHSLVNVLDLYEN
jgi:hypothetical protein